MGLQIDSERAISLIEEKIRELDAYDFESTSWQESCFNTLQRIFSGVESVDISYQIKRIDFSPVFSQNKAQSLTDAKKSARKLLESYIKLIRDFQHQEVNKLQQIIDENTHLISTVHSLQSDNAHLRSLATANATKISNLTEEVNIHKTRYIDFETITSKQLWNFLTGIPVKKIWPYLAVVFSLIASAYFLGTWIQSVRTNTELKH